MSRARAEPFDLGPYRVEAPLRSFGVLTTFRAASPSLGRTVHITGAAPSTHQTEEDRARLLGGAKLMARAGFGVALGVLEILELGEPGGPRRVAVVHEAPTGKDVRELCERRGSLRVEERLALMYDAAGRVGGLHELGIVHGALAPEHLHVQGDDGVRLSFFWSARTMDASATAESSRVVPEAGPEDVYRAPEYGARGAPSATADVFSLGVIAAELLTGEHPFGARDHASLVRAVKSSEPRVHIASGDGVLDKAVSTLLRRALARVPAMRFEHAGKLADDIAFTLGGPAKAREHLRRALSKLRERSVGATPPSEAPPLSTLAARLTVVGGAILAVSLVGHLALSGRSAGPDPRARTTSEARVRVLAHPWADVYVDGALVDTTPIGRPLTLAPGRHELVFKHPHAKDELRTLELAPGAAITVEVEMSIPEPVDAGVDGSP